MRAKPLLLSGLLIALILIRAAPASSSFSLDYVVTGRIWVPSLVVETGGLPPTHLSIALSDFGDCQVEAKKGLLEPRERDCRFERQLGDALETSGMFRRVVRSFEGPDIDAVLLPLRTHVQFRRQVIPVAKPFIVLTFFAYLWTPLPIEMDTESYDLRAAVLDRSGQQLAEIAILREFTHYLNSYSAERRPPDDLVALLEPPEKELGGITVCRGPHASFVIHEFFQRLGDTLKSIRTGQLSSVPESTISSFTTGTESGRTATGTGISGMSGGRDCSATEGGSSTRQSANLAASRI